MFPNFTLPPIIKFPEFYGGQMGVPGSDSPLGIRTANGIVLYVNDNSTEANDNNDGTNPMYPKATIASAIASPLLTRGSIIQVEAEATIEETIIVPSTVAPYVTIAGVTNGMYAPTWRSATAGSVALTLRQQGWRIHGIHFIGRTHDDNACIRVEWDGTDTINASYTMIDHCVFDGAFGGKYGITHWGAPYNVRIFNNEFLEFIHGDGTGAAIWGVGAPTANALEWQVVGNLFWECENYVCSAANDHGFNGSLFANNIFALGSMQAATLKLDLRGGSLGKNIVVGNYFGGADYAQPGGYWDGAAGAGTWVGNFTEDVAEAEVGDNGVTIAPPAA